MSYTEQAERLADQALDGDYGDHEIRMRRFAAAQVYATLEVAEQIYRLTTALMAGRS